MAILALPSAVLAEGHEGMAWIPGGTYQRGNDKKADNGHFYREEAPMHPVTVKGFWMDETEVTNREFAKFVEETGYKTFAEVGPDPADFPKAPKEALKAGSTVFTPPPNDLDPWKSDRWSWWTFTPGADWRHPEGPDSSIKDRMDHPVVCVNYDDAMAYAKWAGKRLPTEAEWERAARGGMEKKMYVWGDKRQPTGKWLANCFQGTFPKTNTAEDGFASTAPVKSFPANAYGLYDMAGNVWEICSDYFSPDAYRNFVKAPTANPQGPKKPITDIEMQKWNRDQLPIPEVKDAHRITHLRSARGGSFLCHVSYCLRYRPAARHYHEPLTPSCHMGFRCVKDAEK